MQVGMIAHIILSNYGSHFPKFGDFWDVSIKTDTKCTFLKNMVQIWPLVQKKKFGYIFRKILLFKIGPRRKQWQGPSSCSVFLECPQEQLLRAASQMPFTLKVFCLHSPEMKCLTFAGFCLGMYPGGGVFEGRALSVPHRWQCRWFLRRHGRWSLRPWQHTTLI